MLLKIPPPPFSHSFAVVVVVLVLLPIFFFLPLLGFIVKIQKPNDRSMME
jgi:hypothetical protein